MLPSPEPLSSDMIQAVLLELNKHNPDLNVIGKITKEGKVYSVINRFFKGTEARYLRLVDVMNKTLAVLEQKGVKFFDPSVKDVSFIEKWRQYRLKNLMYLDVVKQMKVHLSDPSEFSLQLKNSLYELYCREVSLRYALGGANGGLDALDDPDKDLLNILKNAAQNWKKRQKLSVSDPLNALEEEQLNELARYPEWMKIVLVNTENLVKVFNWALRDFNQVEVLVKCYETTAEITKALMPANLGYVRNLCLTPKENEVLAFRILPTKIQNVFKRVLTFSIYHGSFKKFEPHQQERINILKPSKMITFKQGNNRLTIKEFFEEFGQKNKHETNINLCADWGFVNFHPVKGVWRADQQKYEMPSMTKNDWLEHVPPARVASHAELEAQYGSLVNHGDYFFKVVGSRKNPDVNALDCHSFWQIFLKMGDGNWKVMNIGPYGYRFATGFLDNLWLFCSTIARTLCLMDQNGYYTFRQKGAIPVFPSNNAKQSEFLESLYQMIAEHGVFQPSGQNCAYYVQTITDRFFKNLPNFFKMSVSQAKINVTAFDRLLAWTHNKTEWVRWFVLGMIHTIFLSFRWLTVKEGHQEVSYSMRKFYRSNGYIIYNPSYLPHQIMQAKKSGQQPFFNGELYLNHTEEKKFQALAVANKAKP